ncbi:MAG TPA: bifunctional adenosylcobinamide kinase/adenosylcobinamide-phosphate guanylyltransferase [Modestobacter sp.]|nr:bifunctional adenosylcobinamide kinase/adenosylcobinamide-phosphate guanylyltransferase [Modestobacter sp.]
MSRVLVLGGSRSGKSAYAEQLLADRPDVVYLAASSGDPADVEWAARLAAHRARRPAGWTTLETTAPSELLRRGTVLVDSVTSWVAALMDETGVWDETDTGAPGRLAVRCDALINNWVMTPAHVVAVSDEVGLGVVPGTRSGRLFRDTLGTMNQRLAATADEVWFVVAGLPQRLR